MINLRLALFVLFCTISSYNSCFSQSITNENLEIANKVDSLRKGPFRSTIFIYPISYFFFQERPFWGFGAGFEKKILKKTSLNLPIQIVLNEKIKGLFVGLGYKLYPLRNNKVINWSIGNNIRLGRLEGFGYDYDYNIWPPLIKSRKTFSVGYELQNSLLFNYKRINFELNNSLGMNHLPWNSFFVNSNFGISYSFN